MAFTGRAGGRFQMRRLLNGETGAPGAAFIRIPRLGAKPDGVTPRPDEDEIMMAVMRASVLGDIAVITYASPNTAGEFSCAYELTAIAEDGTRTWTLAEQFIDGNLVVAGSVFSNVGLAAGISVSSLDNILAWDSPTDTVPELNPMQAFRGGYIGFVNNPDSTTATPTNPTQEILLVGDETDHLFWNGETLTLSGITIEDPTILITTPPLPVSDQWNAMTAYETGAIVSFNNMIYVALIDNTNVEPGTDTTVWQPSETVSPSVTIAAAQPVMRTHGDLWYDSSIGRLFLFYADDPAVDLTMGTWADVTKN